MRAQLARDFERFGEELPRDFAGHIREAYRIDLAARYLGFSLRIRSARVRASSR